MSEEGFGKCGCGSARVRDKANPMFSICPACTARKPRLRRGIGFDETFDFDDVNEILEEFFSGVMLDENIRKNNQVSMETEAPRAEAVYAP